jgi:hypothetical protein
LGNITTPTRRHIGFDPTGCTTSTRLLRHYEKALGQLQGKSFTLRKRLLAIDEYERLAELLTVAFDTSRRMSTTNGLRPLTTDEPARHRNVRRGAEQLPKAFATAFARLEAIRRFGLDLEANLGRFEAPLSAPGFVFELMNDHWGVQANKYARPWVGDESGGYFPIHTPSPARDHACIREPLSRRRGSFDLGRSRMIETRSSLTLGFHRRTLELPSHDLRHRLPSSPRFFEGDYLARFLSLDTVRDESPELSFPIEQEERLGETRRRSSSTGHEKYSLRDLPFPFVAFREKDAVSVWGRTPSGEPGTVIVERMTGNRWVAAKHLRADRYGVFSARLGAPPHGTTAFRAGLAAPAEKSIPSRSRFR